MVRLALYKLETRGLVDCPRRRQDIVGPKRHPLVSEIARVRDTGLYQPAPNALATQVGFDVEKSELGGGFGFFDQEHGAHDAAVDVCNPGPFAFGIEILDELARHLRDHGLEGVIPAIFFSIEHPLAMDDPADVTGLYVAEAAVRFPAPVAQQALGGRQR